MERVTYPGMDNPIFVDDLLAADQAVLSAAAALTGLEATDFAIISGFDFDGSTNYSAGVIWLYGQFYYCAGGCTTGQYLSGSVVAQLSEGFDDGNSRNIYSSFIATSSNAGGAGFSPQFAGSMDTYRAGSKRLMIAINALQIVAAALGSAAYLNIGTGPGTVMAGNDPRAPYTGAQLDARYAQQVQVIIKGGGTAYTPTAPTDPVNKQYADNVGIQKLAQGTTNVGDIQTGGTTIVCSFGQTLPNTNYMVLFSLEGSAASFNDASSLYPDIPTALKTQLSFTMKFLEGVGTTQNLVVKWTVISMS